MKKEKFLITKILLFSILLFITLNNYVFADVGSFESYDSGSSWSGSSSYGGSSGWSSSDYGSGSSWSTGSSYKSSSSWPSSDYGSGSSWSDSSRSSYRNNQKNSNNSLQAYIAIIFLILIFIIFVVIPIIEKILPRKKANIYNSLESDVIIDPPIYQGIIEERIKEVDKLFNKEEFNEKAKMLFVKMQNAWTNRNWEEIRPFETDELFMQHKTQIDGYIRSNTINIMDRICVLYSKLFAFEQTGDKEILTVVIKSRMADYIIDATTNKILKGDKETERIRFYRLEFIRKAGIKTKPENEGISTTNCPNCGAPNKITSSGQCEYCKSTITNGDFGWVLNNLEPFKY